MWGSRRGLREGNVFSVPGQLELVEIKVETGTAESCQPRTVCQVPSAKEMRNFCLCNPAFHLNNLITVTLMRSKSGSEPRLVYHAIMH